MSIQERFGVPFFAETARRALNCFLQLPIFGFGNRLYPSPPMKATPGLVTWQHPMNIYTPLNRNLKNNAVLTKIKFYGILK